MPARGHSSRDFAGLDVFSRVGQAWFRSAFAAPTAAQSGAWPAISTGENVLVVAPTGSGKTLAAFFWALDDLMQSDPLPSDAGSTVLYVSPLKALAADVQRNLTSPMVGMAREAARLGITTTPITVGMRTGDTPADQRRRLARRPPSILITTPESLFLMLTSQAREGLRNVQTVIVDEIHALAGTKRGAHFAVSMERLDALVGKPVQRIGLSATVMPVDDVATFLGGTHPVGVVAPPSDKEIEISVTVPVADMSQPGYESTDPHDTIAAAPQERASVWPHVERSIVDLINQHESTLVFANSRRLAERITARINEIHEEDEANTSQTATVESGVGARQRTPALILGPSGVSPPSIAASTSTFARAHHGSVSKEQRAIIESELKAGRLKAVVATSSLELGIDMGALDLVIQVEAPPSVAGGLQRVGRAGHSVGQPSRGVIFPKHRADLLASTVIAERMRQRELEPISVPRNPLDVLAQQIVAMVSMDDWSVDELLAIVRRAAPFRTLPESALAAVLDMLSGRYPSDAFAELRPRLTWDRTDGILSARPGAQRIAVTSGGTIPDRGLFPVFVVADRGTRIGELDEEMVYESRVGDVFALGATSWRIEEITHDRVLVSPAPGQPGRLPFWHGDAVGRPAALGEAIGRFSRNLAQATEGEAANMLAELGLDQFAADNLIRYFRDQRLATGQIADDQTIVVERFRDEVGDWRIAIHSPFGARVHAPWALAISAALTGATGLDAQAMHSDDGIILRLPDTDDDQLFEHAVNAIRLNPEHLRDQVTRLVGSSALFAARFRECAARSLLLPRRDPRKRTPLWQQRQRSAALLAVASQHPSFPVVIEAIRECLQDVYDLPALIDLLTKIQSGRVEVLEVTTPVPSPFARSLLFGYVAAYLYEGDSPLAERRAAALTIDSELLGELLGYTELRELLDPDSITEVETQIALLAPDRVARSAEDLADMLRLLGPLPREEWIMRGVSAQWMDELIVKRRAILVRVNSVECLAAIEDAGRLRDALGCPIPMGVPGAFLEPVADPLGDLVRRYARTHGPFSAQAIGEHFGLAPAVVGLVLDRLATSGSLVRGEFRPTATGTEWCDEDVLRRIRRRSIAALRQELEPVPAHTLGLFLPEWQFVTAPGRGIDALMRAVDLLAGCPLPVSALESLILPSRVRDYRPGMLDELSTAGEVVWWGMGRLSGGDGWIALAPGDVAQELLPEFPDRGLAEATQLALLDVLSGGGAWTFTELQNRLADWEGHRLIEALWNLAWEGALTTDTLAPLRALLAAGGKHADWPSNRRLAPRRPRTALSRAARLARSDAPGRGATPRTVCGRWSLVPARSGGQTTRLATQAAAILNRYGIVTRGTINTERFVGGFAAAYRVLTMMEDSGSARRGYVVESLGGAQFALPGAVDLIRTLATQDERSGFPPPARSGSMTTDPQPADSIPTVLLAATDPANPYGAALPWPETAAERAATVSAPIGHRPGRKAGSVVVLVGGHLVAYLERGGRSLLTFPPDRSCAGKLSEGDATTRALRALAAASHAGAIARIRLERIDGQPAATTTLAAELATAGFIATPSGWRSGIR